MLMVGVVQGLVLLWLWKAGEWQSWPAGDPMALGALLWAALVAPLVWYLSENAGAPVRLRLILMGGVAGAYALLGAYAGWLEAAFSGGGEGLRWRGGFGGFAHAVAALALGFVALNLFLQRRRGSWEYAGLFELAWRNASLCISAVALTGLFWMVLFAGASLFKVIGLGFMLDMITQPVFVFPVTALVVAEVFAQGHQRARTFSTMRQYALSLLAWLLPLLLGFSVLWAAALPINGVGKLFATGHAAFFLLWFVALAVQFLNCAWQDGRDELVYPDILSRALSFAWLSLVPVVVIAGWALWLRIDQYGLTEGRIWALFVWVLALMYVLGYGLSVLRRGDWMETVATTNVVVAIVMCVGLALLVSPLADPRRLAVQDQVARLLAGDIAVERFDYRYLGQQSARWGMRALESLAALEGGEREQRIATSARAALDGRYPSRRKSELAPPQALTLEALQQHVEVLSSPGRSAEVPQSLYRWLLTARRVVGGGERPYCPATAPCLLWMTDLNGDGVDEAALLIGFPNGDRTMLSLLLARQGEDWTVTASFHKQMPLSAWREAVSAGNVHLLPKAWPDLKLGDELLPTYRMSE